MERRGATLRGSDLGALALPAFRATVCTAYRSAFGREPAVLEVRAADGASTIG